MAVLGTYLIVSMWLAGNTATAIRLAGVAVVWLLSFCLYFLLIGRHSLANRELQQFWSIGFIPFPFQSIADVSSSFRLVFGIVQFPLGFMAWELPVVLFALGLALVRGRDPLVFWMNVGVIAILAIAAICHLYPISTRLVLFVAPLTVCVIASGVEGTLALVQSHWAAAVAVIGALVAAQLMTLSRGFISPAQTGFPQALQIVSERAKEEDCIYLDHRVGTTYALYQRVLRLPERQTIAGVDHGQDWTDYRSDFDNMHGRVWFIFADYRTSPVDEKGLILLEVRTRGRVLEEVQVGGTSAVLIEMSKVSS
jgi:hypothetical protein